MTRIETLEKIVKQEGGCSGINCNEDKCPFSRACGNGYCHSGNGTPKGVLQQASEMLAKEKGEMKEFKVGEEVEVSNNGASWNKGMYTFYSFDKNLDYPYLVKGRTYDGKTFINSFKYCRKVQLKYKAYTKFNANWLGKKIYFDIYEWEIVGWQNSRVLLYHNDGYGDNYSIVSLEDLVKEYTNEDDIPFGEEIK